MKQSNQATQALIRRILGLAYEITTETATDVFVNYAAHVHQIQVSIYPFGWKGHLRPVRDACICLNPNWERTTIKEVHARLEEEINYLEFLKSVKKGEEE